MSQHNGRDGSARHNDRDFDTAAPHIDSDQAATAVDVVLSLAVTLSLSLYRMSVYQRGRECVI